MPSLGHPPPDHHDPPPSRFDDRVLRDETTKPTAKVMVRYLVRSRPGLAAGAVSPAVMAIAGGTPVEVDGEVYDELIES